MFVAGVMTRDVVTVRPADPYKTAVMTMLKAGVSGLPVVDEDGSVLGSWTIPATSPWSARSCGACLAS